MPFPITLYFIQLLTETNSNVKNSRGYVKYIPLYLIATANNKKGLTGIKKMIERAQLILMIHDQGIRKHKIVKPCIC